MNEKTRPNFWALKQIDAARHRLTKQQQKTLRGQVLAGDSAGAMRGLQRILNRPRQSMTSG